MFLIFTARPSISAHLDPNWSQIAIRWTSEDANTFFTGLVKLIAIADVETAIMVITTLVYKSIVMLGFPWKIK